MFGTGSIASSAVATVVGGVHNTIAHWKVLVFGQLLSFFLAAAGAASEELNGTCHVSVPLTQTALVGGVLMCLGAFKMKGWFAGCYLVRRRRKKKIGDLNENEEENFCSSPLNNNGDGDDVSLRNSKNDGWDAKRSSRPRSFCWGLQTIHAPWPAYFAVALVAVEAQYLIFLSFRYTSFTFIYMMDALAIPSAMVFSKFLLKRRYLPVHVLGGIICIGGITLNTVSDLKGPDDADKIGLRSHVNSQEHLKGDILAVCGAVLLGLDDVLSEMMIKKYGGEDELLFVKWFFGLGISVFQLLILEEDSLVAFFENQGGEPCKVSMRFLLLGVYVVFQALDKAGEIRFLGISEAALLNLSLLTSDLWAAAFSTFAEGVVPSVSYFVALLLIVSGIVMYEAGPSPISHSTPSNIKITMHHADTEHATDVKKGDVEMT
mmetsp:Transcript_36910/g.79694  ORF Transcript_36910/g.79694 Transcript_36910/m.79694 type:complete len:432 (-) Transcript_36910:129-1424(-)